MKNKILILTLCAAACVTAQPQFQMPKPTVGDTLTSISVSPDRTVTFRIFAPDAKKIAVSCDYWNPKGVEFTKADNGVWEGQLANVPAGSYRYSFAVDGVTVRDPRTAEASADRPTFIVDPSGDSFFEMKNVPHGAVSQVYYQSKTMNTTRRMHVWTPAGYNKMTGKLPVLYLIHGGGDNDKAWPGVGCANFILDNLLAEGKIAPMIVVMPNGSIDVNKFADDMMNDIIPYVESNYNVYTDKDHRALMGLSMGGLEVLTTGLNNYKSFGYLCVLSSGWFKNQQDVLNERGAYLKKIGADFNKTVKLLTFTQGGPEDIAYENCKNMLKLFDAAGIKYEFSEMPGGHSWLVWRNNLKDLAPRLFK